MHHHTQLIVLFNQCFKGPWGTELVRGGDEPIYIPRSRYYPWDRVIFAYGYFSSAMHEISHWCIAGAERRKLVDFGYWYNPDGRTEAQQIEFEKVEIKPQALEWILCRAANFKFNVSLDNLNGDISETAKAAEQFKDNICIQVNHYLENGLPERAQIFVDTLIGTYRQGRSLCIEEFKREDL